MWKKNRHTKHYLEKFQSNINNLEPVEKERVIAVFSLERFRTSVMKKQTKAGLKILKENHVKLKYKVRYFRYLVKRIITHRSYGFNGF